MTTATSSTIAIAVNGERLALDTSHARANWGNGIGMTETPGKLALGGALALAAWASGACAEQARTPLKTVKDIETAIRACWIPPPIEQARPGMQITVLMSFRRDGALLGQPKVTFESVGATDDERLA